MKIKTLAFSIFIAFAGQTFAFDQPGHAPAAQPAKPAATPVAAPKPTVTAPAAPAAQGGSMPWDRGVSNAPNSNAVAAGGVAANQIAMTNSDFDTLMKSAIANLDVEGVKNLLNSGVRFSFSRSDGYPAEDAVVVQDPTSMLFLRAPIQPSKAYMMMASGFWFNQYNKSNFSSQLQYDVIGFWKGPQSIPTVKRSEIELLFTKRNNQIHQQETRNYLDKETRFRTIIALIDANTPVVDKYLYLLYAKRAIENRRYDLAQWFVAKWKEALPEIRKARPYWNPIPYSPKDVGQAAQLSINDSMLMLWKPDGVVVPAGTSDADFEAQQVARLAFLLTPPIAQELSAATTNVCMLEAEYVKNQKATAPAFREIGGLAKDMFTAFGPYRANLAFINGEVPSVTKAIPDETAQRWKNSRDDFGHNTLRSLGRAILPADAAMGLWRELLAFPGAKAIYSQYQSAKTGNTVLHVLAMSAEPSTSSDWRGDRYTPSFTTEQYLNVKSIRFTDNRTGLQIASGYLMRALVQDGVNFKLANKDGQAVASMVANRQATAIPSNRNEPFVNYVPLSALTLDPEHFPAAVECSKYYYKGYGEYFKPEN